MLDGERPQSGVLVKDVHRAFPNVEVRQLPLFVPSAFMKTSEGERPVRGSGMWFTRNTACFTARGVRVGLAT